MKIAQLRDAQAVQSGRKIGDGNFDFAHGKPEALRNETVSRAYERHRAGNHPCGLKKVTPGMVDFFRSGDRSAIAARGRLDRFWEPAGFSEGDLCKRLHSHSAPATVLMNR